jgi:hypothetical protein
MFLLPFIARSRLYIFFRPPFSRPVGCFSSEFPMNVVAVAHVPLRWQGGDAVKDSFLNCVFAFATYAINTAICVPPVA